MIITVGKGCGAPDSTSPHTNPGGPNVITTRTPDERMVEAYRVLERMGKKAEQGLAQARKFEDAVPLPICTILVPALEAVAVREACGRLDGRDSVTAPIEAKRAAQHVRYEPVVDAALHVTLTWGKALKCMAENATGPDLIEMLAETETELNQAVEKLQHQTAALAAYCTSMRPGANRIKAIVGPGGLEAAEKLLVDLLHYAAENQADLCRLLISGLSTWDDETAYETGEVWCTDPNEGSAHMLAALKESHLRRYDPDDREDAWDSVVRLAEDKLSRQPGQE
jgi:hypothetical protein